MAVKLGGQLRSLREDRNGADYRMDDVQFETCVNAQLRVSIATGVIAAIDALFADPNRSNMRRLLRPKARAMGLDVVGFD
jgi:hypothetical protein